MESQRSKLKGLVNTFSLADYPKKSNPVILFHVEHAESRYEGNEKITV